MNKLQKIADRLNHSPIWNHTMLLVLLYFWEMVILTGIIISEVFTKIYSPWEDFKVWLIMTVPLILGWLLLGLRNYYINKKIGIWKYYQSKTRNGKLMD